MEDCPYIPGAEFTVLLQLETPESSDMNPTPPIYLGLKVLRTYTFTQSATMKCSITSSPIPAQLPPVVFLKLYDRRFLSDRLKKPGSWKHWTQEKEDKANEELLSGLDCQSAGTADEKDDAIKNSSDAQFGRPHEPQEQNLHEIDSWSSAEGSVRGDLNHRTEKLAGVRKGAGEPLRQGEPSSWSSSESTRNGVFGLQNGESNTSQELHLVDEDDLVPDQNREPRNLLNKQEEPSSWSSAYSAINEGLILPNGKSYVSSQLHPISNNHITESEEYRQQESPASWLSAKTDTSSPENLRSTRSYSFDKATIEIEPNPFVEGWKVQQNQESWDLSSPNYEVFDWRVTWEKCRAYIQARKTREETDDMDAWIPWQGSADTRRVYEKPSWSSAEGDGNNANQLHNLGDSEEEYQKIHCEWWDRPDDEGFELLYWDEEDHPTEQWIIEEAYRRRVNRWFWKESDAYRKLKRMQGIEIPIFYGTTTFHEASLDLMPAGVLPEVHGILLQHIEGYSLDDVEPDSDLFQRFPDMGWVAVSHLRRLSEFETIHGDLRVGNFLVRESDGRVFLLDFAHAIIRPKAQEEMYWRERVREEWEADALREFLRKRGLVQCEQAKGVI